MKYWFVLLVFYFFTRLPFAWQRPIGRAVGFLLFHFASYSRHVTAVNLRLCFPELSQKQQRHLLKNHFILLGMGMVEAAGSWWIPDSRFDPDVSYEGLEHLHQALDRKQGVILLSGHFTTIEISGRLLARKIPFDVTYRQHNNAVFEYFMSRGLERYVGKPIGRKDVRGMLRSLRAGHAVFYAPDQDFGRKHCIFVPFMGVATATASTTHRWARISGSPVVPFFCERTTNGYHIKLLPALDGFPSECVEQDTTRVNQLLEQQIRLDPANYIWVHKRFKTRPDGEAYPY